jgi:hypothetical protein
MKKIIRRMPPERGYQYMRGGTQIEPDSPDEFVPHQQT